MPKANLVLQDGTKVTIEGSAEEVSALLERLSATPTSKVGGKGSRTRRRSAPPGQGGDEKRTRRGAGGPSAVRDLDLAPAGEKSLREFVAEKQPKTNHDKNVVAVYYLAEVLRLGTVTLNQVFTCYKDMRWREPGNLGNSLAVTANRKRFLDTANLDDIKLTPAGRNHVDLDLPAAKKQGS